MPRIDKPDSLVSVTGYPGEPAVISPCSRCPKFGSDPEKDEYPACPRRYWAEMQKDYEKRDRKWPVPPHLLETGTEDRNTVANPVYTKAHRSILVWVAKLINNRPRKKEGQVTSDLLDPGYPTKYLACELHPYSVQETQASIWGRGAYKEEDLVLLTPVPYTQLRKDESSLLPFAGFCQKVLFPYYFDNESPQWDRIVSGA